MNTQVQPKNRLAQLAVGASALSSSLAMAAVDVSGAETAISDGIPAITSLGTSVLGVLVVAAIFKWVRRVF